VVERRRPHLHLGCKAARALHPKVPHASSDYAKWRTALKGPLHDQLLSAVRQLHCLAIPCVGRLWGRHPNGFAPQFFCFRNAPDPALLAFRC
jgi:hypothetical protein